MWWQRSHARLVRTSINRAGYQSDHRSSSLRRRSRRWDRWRRRCGGQGWLRRRWRRWRCGSDSRLESRDDDAYAPSRELRWRGWSRTQRWRWRKLWVRCRWTIRRDLVCGVDPAHLWDLNVRTWRRWRRWKGSNPSGGRGSRQHTRLNRMCSLNISQTPTCSSNTTRQTPFAMWHWIAIIT